MKNKIRDKFILNTNKQFPKCFTYNLYMVIINLKRPYI